MLILSPQSNPANIYGMEIPNVSFDPYQNVTSGGLSVPTSNIVESEKGGFDSILGFLSKTAEAAGNIYDVYASRKKAAEITNASTSVNTTENPNPAQNGDKKFFDTPGVKTAALVFGGLVILSGVYMLKR